MIQPAAAMLKTLTPTNLQPPNPPTHTDTSLTCTHADTHNRTQVSSVGAFGSGGKGALDRIVDAFTAGGGPHPEAAPGATPARRGRRGAGKAGADSSESGRDSNPGPLRRFHLVWASNLGEQRYMGTSGAAIQTGLWGGCMQSHLQGSDMSAGSHPTCAHHHPRQT